MTAWGQGRIKEGWEGMGNRESLVSQERQGSTFIGWDRMDTQEVRQAEPPGIPRDRPVTDSPVAVSVMVWG